jgi:hypothetical protein
LFLAPDSTKASITNVAKGIVETGHKLGQNLTKVIYSDNCCHDRKFYEEICPQLKENLEVPSFKEFDTASLNFDFADNSHLTDYCVAKLREVVDHLNDKIVSLDTEWTVDLISGRHRPVAVIQIAVDGYCCIFQVSQSRLSAPVKRDDGTYVLGVCPCLWWNF